jgi:hypothetical protein
VLEENIALQPLELEELLFCDALLADDGGLRAVRLSRRNCILVLEAVEVDDAGGVGGAARCGCMT